MKLRDLRELYEVPKDENDEGAREPGSMRALMGIDPASGPDRCAVTFRCEKCDLIVTLPDMPHKAVIVALCPKCDACALCTKMYTESGDPLPLKSGLRVAVVDGELVEQAFNVCEPCLNQDDQAKLRDMVDRWSKTVGFGVREPE